MGIAKHNKDSIYNDSVIGKSAELIQSGRDPYMDYYGRKKNEKRLRSNYLNDLGRQQYRNRESSSYLCEEPERNCANRHGVEVQPDLQMKHGRRRHRGHGRRHLHRSYRKSNCNRFWKSFRRLFKAKGERDRRHCYRSWEEELADERYPSVREAISVSSITSVLTPAETKAMQTFPPHPPAEKEKTEEKEKSMEKVIKSTPMEQMPQKMSETFYIASLIDIIEMRQKWKITQFIEQIAKAGMEGIKDEFVHCRSFIPNAVTRIAHDRNLKRCRYPGIILTSFAVQNIAGQRMLIIITQLPLSNTVKHFWEMVWQENVQIILLFLTLNEWKQHAENIRLIPGKGKCLHIEDFMILTHKNEFNITPDWLVREYYLSRNDKTRRIFWYHYSAWEPNRSPGDCEHLWPLHSSLRIYGITMLISPLTPNFFFFKFRKMRRPYVCMSLAGAGRAGCYAALEWAHLMLHDKEASIINIVDCVHKVRTYRMHAVQTIAQFQFLYMGIQRHIFLIEKIRKEILSERTIFEAAKKCSSIEYKHFRSDDYPADDEFDL
ncbi:hypothetical protein X798_04118 [Onchocerca flexuosa]|uniref:Protein-tyrosine phosphatase n=1 Tax=Onchocerca flexuosa TaxID=387005 RepID=A0A238BVF1_9BILA|nr:hypothetical protein X798_04118 [Onchocerca flexuosa]